MKKTIIYYILATLLNCLLLPASISTFGFLAPVQVLICWLAFERLARRPYFVCFANVYLMAVIPPLSLLVSAILILLADGWPASGPALIELLFNFMMLIILLVAVAEFFVLLFLFSKIKLKRDSGIK